MGTNLWRKLTLEWPCAIGDWLWRVLVVELAEFLNRLTPRRTIFFVALILFLIAILYTRMFVLSDALVIAGDAATYFDIVAAVIFVAVKGRAYQTLRVVGRQAVVAAQGLSKILARYRNEARQRRNANALQRKRVRDNPKPSDDEPAGLVWTDMSEAFA